LLVEDNPENVVLLHAYLDNLSLSLGFAANGVEALEERKHGSYDLVLMDIQMPIMDGYTATREIRAWEKVHGVRPVPVVALTAHALSGAATESMEAGCDAHLTKPILRNDLVQAIGKFAQRPVHHQTTVQQQAPRESEPVREQVNAAIPAPIAALRPTFLANRQLDLKKMRVALAARDFKTVQSIGHNCKGTGTGYGFPEISKLGSAIESEAKALDPDQLQESLTQFESCLEAASASVSG
jgi:CheY-like chemotaxis protein